MEDTNDIILTTEQLRTVLEEIKNRTKTKILEIEINPEKEPTIFTSKFGGVPYWDLKMEYPTGSEETKLMLLAQINLSEIKEESLLPKEGMLQFFIKDDDMMGADFENQDIQKDFRVIYHKSIDTSVNEQSVLALDIPIAGKNNNDDIESFCPVEKEVSIDIKQSNMYITFSDYLFNEVFRQAVKDKLDIDLPEDEEFYSFVDDDDFDILDEELPSGGHRMFGSPFFTQTDPREYNDELKRYNTLLFQMDSDYENDDDYVLWGDAGVGNFFINDEDLKNCDFSKILYNWDCC